MAELQPGADAPAFTLPDQSGSPVSLSDFSGRKVLLFFYPKAGTGG
jgi:thioredoxin-dependent peroxiredoxin